MKTEMNINTLKSVWCKTATFAISLVISVAMMPSSLFASLLYSYDFNEIGESGLVLENKGYGTGVMTLKQNGGSESAPYTEYGAQCSPYAFCSNDHGNSLWLGTSDASLGCSTDKGFTISFWVKPTASHKAWSNFFGFRVGGYNYRFEYIHDNTSTFRMYCLSPSDVSSNSSPDMTQAAAGKWSHIALVFNGSEDIPIYINGECVAIMPLGTPGDLQQIFVGQTLLRHGTVVRCYPNNSSPTGTAIDDIDVYDAPLSVGQIKSLATLRRRSMPLWWKFDEINDRGQTGANSGSGNYTAFKWNPKNYSDGSDYGMYQTPGAFDTTHSFWLDASNGKGKYWANFCVTNLQETAGSGFSFSFWLYASGRGKDWRSIFGYVLGTTKFRLAWGDNDTDSNFYCGGNNITAKKFSGFETNKWQHFAFVYNRAEATTDVYIDGERKAQLAFNVMPADSENISRISVGPWADGSNISEGWYKKYNQNVQVDEFAFFNYSLTADEIALLGTRLPVLPKSDVTSVTRTVAVSGTWGGTLESWTAGSRLVPWPAFEDATVDATLVLSDGMTITNDTFVTPKSLSLAVATSATLPVNATLRADPDTFFAPQSLEIAEGLQLTIPLYMVNVGGTLTLGESSKIIFDVSNFNDGGTSNALNVGAFALPSGETDVLAHFATTDPAYALSLSADGKTIFVTADSVPVMAKWTGEGDGKSLGSAANWECRNASGALLPADTLPGKHTRVVVSSDTAVMDAPAGTVFPWPYLSFEADNVTLLAKTDWRGIPSLTIPDGVTVDLKGNSLYLNERVTGEGEITDTAEKGGELHLDVASGKTFKNLALPETAISISGSLKLVKEGDGTYISAKVQSYAGGTYIVKGIAQPPTAPSGNNVTYCASRFKAFGTGAITVAANGKFDLKGNYDYRVYMIRLEGGTLANSGPEMTKSSWGGSGFSSLGADSTLDVPMSLVFQCGGDATCDLGGHTLTVNLSSRQHIYIRGATFRNGKAEIGPSGWLHPVEAIDASTVDFKVSCALDVDAQFDVHDYEALFENNNNSGTANLNVHGTFKPSKHDYFYGCTMLDGSTIDLSSRTNALPLVSAFTDGKNTLEFVDGATVYVKFGGRSASMKEPLISWAEGTDIGTVKFKNVSGELNCVFQKRSDGLYMTHGFMVLIR